LEDEVNDPIGGQDDVSRLAPATPPPPLAVTVKRNRPVLNPDSGPTAGSAPSPTRLGSSPAFYRGQITMMRVPATKTAMTERAHLSQSFCMTDRVPCGVAAREDGAAYGTRPRYPS
jgi:hypothetical protein